MTDILCKWLNDEVKLSKKVEKCNIAQDFATGYYLGEILHKHQLQNDFEAFSTGQTADAKLNNFTRVEPTLHLLQIPFDSNVAYDIMMLKHGIATRLLYQLYIALQRKNKSKLTGVAMETMRASAPVNLERIETGLYQQRLKTLVPRESDLTTRAVSTSFVAKREANERKALDAVFRENEEFEKIKQEQRQIQLEKARIAKQKQTELLAKIQAAAVHIPKPPPVKTLKAINQRKELRRKREAAETIGHIEKFEKNLKRLVAPTSSEDAEDGDRTDGSVESSMEYLQRIKDRLEEDSMAREERAKRRRKVLVDQMKAHQAQEEALRQEQIVQRLMRQSTQEKRIAVQLMQARHEKDVMRKNRIFQEKQHEERRLNDFQDALNREQELCKQAREDYAEELEREREVHARIMNEKAQKRYRNHYEMCRGVLDLILDFSCKIAEYRELTENKVPDKLVREWRNLLLNGQPLYEEEQKDETLAVELKRQEILDDQDLAEYKSMLGEWNMQEGSTMKLPPANNTILGHILHRMFSLIAPTPPPTPPPQFPDFPIKVAVVGKMFCGKTTVLQRLCREHNTVRLSVDQLVAEAVECHQAKEVQPIALRHAKSEPGLPTTSVMVDPPTPQREYSSLQELQNNEQKDVDVILEKDDVDEEKNVEKQADPVEVDDTEQTKEHAKSPEPQEIPTLRASLGEKALNFLRKGQAVSDEVLVEIIMEAIRKLPDGTGWILDGFPTNLEQAILLEKALTGKDVSSTTSIPEKKKRKSTLVSSSKTEIEPPPPQSGLDLMIVLDVSDDVAIKRAYGRTEAKLAGKVYHEEFRPPPAGSQTGQGKVEKVESVNDPSFDKEQIQHRIDVFHDNWPGLEKLYEKISTIRRVDAEAESEVVYKDFEQCFFDAMEKLEEKPVIVEPVQEPPPPEEEPPVEPAPAAIPEEGDAARPASAFSRKSGDSGGSEGKKSRKSSARGRSGTKDEEKKEKSRPSSSKSPKGKKRGKSKTPSPAPPPVEQPPEEPTGPPPPQPGEPDWVYVDEDISDELVKSLVPYWDNTENSYVKNLKYTFRQIRSERENIVRYLYEIRQGFIQHLRRPDPKQIYVSGWQKDFNELNDDLREDEESKAELHQRLDDLRERLWDICDTRKEQIEEERNNLIAEGWIEDHLGILANHYLTLMQAEVDRFQDTVHILKDYYSGMQARIPSEVGPPAEFLRLPLIEMEVGGDTSATLSAGTLAASESTISIQPQQSPTKQPRKSTDELSGDVKEIKEEGTTSVAAVASRTKIPLVQRGGPVGPQASDESSKGKKGKGANVAQGSESPTADENLEEKTVGESFNFALSLVTTTVQSRVSEKEAEEEEDRRLKEEEEKAKAALLPVDKKGKSAKGGKQSAKGKKDKKKSRSPTPVPITPVEESEEEKKKKETAIRLREEYFAALFQEEAGVKERMELIKNRAQVTLAELREKSDQTFSDMNDWLGSRYLREMAAVDALTNYARRHIEEARKLDLELKLEQDEFIINSERKLISSPVPPPRPPPVEVAQPDVFTVNQLRNMLSQFREVAPGGAIMNKAFVELLAETAALTHGLDTLPDMWLSITYSQLLDLCSLLSPQSEYIDWRKFLIIAAQPWPKPTMEQLLQIREDFVIADVAGNGWITRDQYDRVDLWFPTDERPLLTPDDAEEPYPYNRNGNLRDFFYDLFADWQQTPPRLDYINMLIYFASDKDSLTGFFRALAVSSGQAIPKFSMRPDVLLYAADKEISPEEVEPADYAPEQLTSFKRIHIDLESTPTPLIPVESWWLVLHHGSSRLGDSHRFSMTEDPEEKYSMERLRLIYSELGANSGEALPIQILIRHTVIQEALESSKRHRLPDIRSIFVPPALQALDTQEIGSESLGTN